MSRSYMTLAPVLVLLAGMAMAPTAILAADPPKPALEGKPIKGPAVSTTEARRGTIRDTVTVGGTLVAREEILVAAQVDGLAIVEILVDEGSRVRKGDILARLSREAIDITIGQNRAQLARADAAIAQAKAQIVDAQAAKDAALSAFTRAKNLREGGITTVENYEQRQSLALQTSARVTSAQETFKLAEADKAVIQAQSADLALKLVRTDIKAPADGVISRRTARLGGIAAGAADPLFRIIENGIIELEADIAEAALARLKVDQVAKVRPAGHAVDVDAKVRLISPEVSRTTRLGKVRLVLTNSNDLAIGAFARGVIEVARSEGILLPLSAVQFGPDGARVQVVINGIVATRPVTTGLRSSTMVEIVKGLEAGEQVVSIAGSFLRNGDRITPVPQQVISN